MSALLLAMTLVLGVSAISCIVIAGSNTFRLTALGVSAINGLIGFSGGKLMNFVEQLFRVAPDGGTGMLEVMLLLIPMMAGVAWRFMMMKKPVR